jgi:hypothetical protein
MRTKVLLGAAVIAAGALTSMAQSNVYSLNVVGYVNITFPSFQTYLVANPLDNTNNDLNTVLPGAPDSSTVQLWDVGAQDFITTSSYDAGSGKWIPNLTVNPGQGFFLTAGAANYTNTFVGNVRQGALTNKVAGFNLVLVGSQVPVAGDLNSAAANGTNFIAGYVPLDSDTIQAWDITAQDFINTTSYDAGAGKWIPDMTFKVGDAFFLSRAGADADWVLNFTVK